MESLFEQAIDAKAPHIIFDKQPAKTESEWKPAFTKKSKPKPEVRPSSSKKTVFSRQGHRDKVSVAVGGSTHLAEFTDKSSEHEITQILSKNSIGTKMTGGGGR